jgi:DNA/RNA-binding domain of Phe-tRNA-synthetase-like protein
MISFRVTPEVFDRVPHARFAVVVARGIDNRQSPHVAAGYLSQAVAAVVGHFGSLHPKEHPAIAAWREVFRRLGWSPSTYQSSVEALVRRSLRGKPPPSINPAVDLANSVSLRFLVPVGVHDLGTAPLGLAVRLTRPGDWFLPMGGAPQETPEPGEIVYAHEADIRTRRWVWRQSRTGLVGPETVDALFPLDGFAGVTEDAVRQAASGLASLVQDLLGGEVHVGWVDPNHPEVSLR